MFAPIFKGLQGFFNAVVAIFLATLAVRPPSDLIGLPKTSAAIVLSLTLLGLFNYFLSINQIKTNEFRKLNQQKCFS